MVVGVTGGTGFIGRELVLALLERAVSVRVLTRRVSKSAVLPDSVKVFNGDLTGSPESLKPFVDGLDVLYHCAGETGVREKMFSTHVTGTGNLCAAADRRIGHWVQLSSVGAYGPCSNGVIDEDSPVRPEGDYEKTKTDSDRLVIEAAARGAFTCSILRPSNVFGPTMRNQSLFQLIEMLNSGFFFFIGPPGASANYIHVGNVVEGLTRCGNMPRARGRVYNLSDHRTIEDLCKIISGQLGRHAPSMRLPVWMARLAARAFRSLPRFPLTEQRVRALTNRSRYPIRRIQDELGYAHVVSMEEGLKQLIMRRYP